MNLIFEEEEEGSNFLVPDATPGGAASRAAPGAGPARQAGPTGPALDSGPREIGVTTGREEIIPAAPPVPPTSPTPAGHGTVGGPPGAAGGAASTGGGGGAGGAGSIFPVGRQVRSVVYVIDRSSSMAGGLLTGAVRELHASLERLPVQTQFQVVVYHDQAETLLPLRGLLPASSENVARAALALEQLRPEGGTNHLRALQMALSLGAEVVYFLTDADDLSDDERREITRLNRGRSIIHTIELNTANRDRVNMPLQILARENRGRYQAVSP
ncbi:MAG: VWA domain-containing protein [Gemmataceae bacterium]|nr:VWA domain-containing protein [Gemmataceae bacterium]